jgi:NADPH-dependent 2,4-dienoyl-CoA reductase/sulfur reductase-like enzyme
LTGCVVALDAADRGHSVVVDDREADIFRVQLPPKKVKFILAMSIRRTLLSTRQNA